MSKRIAHQDGYALCYAVLTCPFCRERTVENPTMPWCSNSACLVEYYESRTVCPLTGRRRFVFDNKRKTPRFAMAKAVMASGGIRIGGKS